MKSITCRLITSSYGYSFFYVILAFISSVICSPPLCGLYGAPPCQFLPAPPGQTPACARPGKTYCEQVDNYPTYLIKHLVHKWGYEAKNLIVDETWDDFAAVAWRDTPVFYDPAYIFPQKNGNEFGGYRYKRPPTTNVAQQTTQVPTFLLYTSAAQNLNLNKNNVVDTTPNNPTFWLKRITRDVSSMETAGFTDAYLTSAPVEQDIYLDQNSTAIESARHYDVSPKMNLLDVVGVKADDKQTNDRNKRQTPGRDTLCTTRSMFVMPKAALNSKGNWMFVVNEANTARQMVKAELCTSNTCSNLCELPNGYNSRCEQKFVQKRLIALQGNGQNLYTDTFWFPSCCVCTISSF